MVSVQLPDGSVKDYPAGSSSLDVAKSIGQRLAAACLAAEVNGKVVDLGEALPEGETVQLKLLTEKDAAALGVMRHSAASMVARAVMRLYPGVQLAFGPTIANGFYYDFDLEHKIKEEDFPKIEAEIAGVVKEAEPFERFSLSKEESLKFCQGMKQDLKVEHIGTGLADHAEMSFYRQGEFVDLCRGPHIPDAGRVKAIKLLKHGGVVLEGGREQSAVAAVVRNRVVQPEGSGCLSAAGGRGEAARSSVDRETVRIVSHQSGSGAGFVPVVAEGGDHPEPAGRLHQGGVAQSRVQPGLYPAYRTGGRVCRPADNFRTIGILSSRRCSEARGLRWSITGSPN